MLFLPAYFSSGDRTRASRPTYLICIFWSCAPAVQTVKEKAGTACPDCTAAFGKGYGLLFLRVDGFKDEAPLQLSAALCEITGCGYMEVRGIRPWQRGGEHNKTQNIVGNGEGK